MRTIDPATNHVIEYNSFEELRSKSQRIRNALGADHSVIIPELIPFLPAVPITKKNVWALKDGELICSVLIPTRWRVQRLKRAIKSVFDTACNPDKVECVLHICSSDNETLDAIPDLKKMGNVRFIITGKSAYDEHADMWWEIAQMARGVWIWLLDDDGYLLPECRGWDEKLFEFKTSGIILLTEWHRLNTSGYRREHHPFIIFPNRSWVELGIKKFSNPMDAMIFEFYLRRNNWNLEFIPGACTFHERINDNLVIHQGRRLGL